eukprot:2645770-Rhodomonas_salina.3
MVQQNTAAVVLTCELRYLLQLSATAPAAVLYLYLLPILLSAYARCLPMRGTVAQRVVLCAPLSATAACIRAAWYWYSVWCYRHIPVLTRRMLLRHSPLLTRRMLLRIPGTDAVYAATAQPSTDTAYAATAQRY